MKFIISAGGTGGHIMPALSIAKELIKRGHEILYIGNKDSMEEKLVSRENIQFEAIDVQKIYRRLTLKHLSFPFKLAKSIHKVFAIFDRFKPDAYIGAGGFVSGPAGFVARQRAIPYFLQEQNSYPGLTTKLLEKSAKALYIGQQNAKKHLKNANIIYSGNPINKELIFSQKRASFDTLNFDTKKKCLFLIGGSQGSLALNRLLDKAVDRLLKQYNIIWQLGKVTYHDFEPKHRGKQGLYMFDFSYEIDTLYNITDIAISRSGAITVAELEAKKIPAILVPLPSAAENHQFKNAIEQTEKNIATTLEQNNLDDNLLIHEIANIDKNTLDYTNSFQNCIHLDSVDTITNSILELLTLR